MPRAPVAGQEGALVLALNLASMMARAPEPGCHVARALLGTEGHPGAAYHDWACDLVQCNSGWLGLLTIQIEIAPLSLLPARLHLHVPQVKSSRLWLKELTH